VIRAVFEETILFLVPFVIFAVLLMLGRRNPLRREAWSGRLPILAIAGLLCVIAGFVLTGILSDRPSGKVYEPAHMEDGRLVPGRFR
jgi:hypothetical protein